MLRMLQMKSKIVWSVTIHWMYLKTSLSTVTQRTLNARNVQILLTVHSNDKTDVGQDSRYYNS